MKIIRFASIFICLMLMCNALLFALSGCSGNSNAEAVMAAVDHVYRSATIEFPENYELNDVIEYKDGRIYTSCMELLDLDNETYETRYILYSFDINGENPQSSVIEFDGDSSGQQINNYIFTPDGGSLIYCYTYNEEDYSVNYFLIKCDSEGNETARADIKDIFTENSEYVYVSEIVTDNEGNIFLSGDKAVYVLSSNLEKLFVINTDSYVENMGLAGNGKVFISYYDSLNNYTNVKKYIDVSKKALGADIKIPTDVQSNYSYIAGSGYDIYLRDETGLYAYNEGDAELTYLCNWINSDIIPNSTYDITIISPEIFISADYDEFVNARVLNVMTKVPDDEIVPKYIINVAHFYAEQSLIKAAIKFNRENDKYRIVLNDYSKFATDENYYQGTVVLNNEIISGNVPDIVVCDSSDLPYQSYNSKGIFTDLYEFIDNDDEFSRDMLLKCVTDSFETDGKLYQLATQFMISTLAGKASIIGSEPGWTFDEMLEILKNQPDGTTLLGEDTTKSSMMLMLMTGMNEFYDLDKGTCDFNNDSFKHLLEYANTFAEEFDYSSYYENNDYYSSYIEGRTLLSTSYIGSFDDILRLKFIFGNEPVTYKGYPAASGNGSNIISNYNYSIAEKSRVKEGAWQFIKYLLSDDMLVNDMYMFPCTVSAFNKSAENELNFEYEFDTNGGYSKRTVDDESYISGGVVALPISGDGTANSGSNVSTKMRLSQEDIDSLKAFLNTIDSSVSYDSKIIEIIMEESKVYFAGDKSVDETIKVIQSRVSLYLSENY